MFVPWASFVLQMALLIISMREYELYDGETRINLENEFSFARISPDGATEACRALQQNLGLQVRKDRSGKETIKEPFSKTIEMIWQTLAMSALDWNRLNHSFKNQVTLLRNIFMALTCWMLRKWNTRCESNRWKLMNLGRALPVSKR
jgi:hypothetical protein